MVWCEYYAALFGYAQFMRRHSLAIYLVMSAAETPAIAGVSSLYQASISQLLSS